MDIREVVKSYLSANGITITHFSKCIGRNYAVVNKWLNGNPEIRMKEDTMKRIYAFLSGKYYLTVDEAIETGGDKKTCK